MAGREFFDDLWLRQRVARELRECEMDHDDFAVTSLIADAIETAVDDMRERVSDLYGCYKPDQCRPEAVVMDRIATWLENRSHA